MSDKKEIWFNTNRQFWAMGIVCFLGLAYVLAVFSFVPCKCEYGELSSEAMWKVYWISIGLVLIRMIVGFILRQKKKIIPLYVALPLVLDFTCAFINSIIRHN